MPHRRERKITMAQLERAIGIIGTVAQYADLDGEERDAFGVTIQALDLIAASGGITIPAAGAAAQED